MSNDPDRPRPKHPGDVAIDPSTGGGTYHPGSARQNFFRQLLPRRRPVLSLEPLASSPEQNPAAQVRLSATGDSVEVEWLGAWTPECDLRFDLDHLVLSPRSARTSMKLNGVTLPGPTRVEHGDLIDWFGDAFRIAIAGSEPKPDSLVSSAELLAAEARVGLLTFDGKRLLLRANGSHSQLASLSRTPLARAAERVDIVLPGLDAQALETALEALGPIREKSTLIVPSPPGTRSNVTIAEAVEVRLNGELLATDGATYLEFRGAEARTRGTFMPGPALVPVGQGLQLSFREGTDEVEAIQLAGAELAIVPDVGTRVQLLAGDEWTIRCRGVEHSLSVQARTTERRPAQVEQPQRLTVDGHDVHRVVIHLADRDLTFSQDHDGIFRSPDSPAQFGIVGLEQLRIIGSDKPRDFTFYDLVSLSLEVGAPAGVLLPGPSDFLRKRVRFPADLSHAGVAVFVDELLERRDGSAIALRRLIDSPPDEMARWFLRLLTTPTARRKLRAWLERNATSLSRFEQVLTLRDEDPVSAILNAIRTEAIFQFVREVRIDSRSTGWAHEMRAWGPIPGVTVVDSHHG